MPHSTAQRHRAAGSNNSLRYFAYLSLCSIAACVIVRAPTIFEEGQIPVIDLKLKLNAGYILVFGPLLIVCTIAAITYLGRDNRPDRTKESASAGVLARAIPCLAAAYLSLQFFLLFAPNGQCPTFPRWRYLTDWTLSAFKPEYCMSLPAETQERMPWLFGPPIVQAWVQVLLPLIALGLVIRDWRSTHRRG
jgi:hypothetical protein